MYTESVLSGFVGFCRVLSGQNPQKQRFFVGEIWPPRSIKPSKYIAKMEIHRNPTKPDNLVLWGFFKIPALRGGLSVMPA
ncbi:MAG: hypothetical protein F6K34_20280 [Okeania sp. SIO4D6]|nr:hypothetical protein [Okeania sp. SIO4D6]